MQPTDNAGPTDEVAETLVDARGHQCPVPTLRLRKALETSLQVRLLADDPMARIDVPHFAAQAGFEVLESAEEAGTLSFVVRRGS